MAKRKTQYSDVPDDAIFVSIYCAGAADTAGRPSHGDRPWRIATFFPDGEAPQWPNGDLRWSEVFHQYWTADGQVINLGTKSRRVSLVREADGLNDRVVARDEYRANPAVFDNGSRSRVNFKCGNCSLPLAIRSEKLDPFLNEFASLGLREVPLVALAARLHKRI